MSLIDSVVSGDVVKARELLEGGADPDSRSEWGCTALSLATGSEALPIVDLLLQHGADVTAVDADGGTALHAAPRRTDIVERLLDAGVPIDHQDSLGHTALFLSVTEPGIVELLLARGADPNRATTKMETPLSLCAACGHLESARRLLDHGANPNYIDDEEGWSVLFHAAYSGETDIVELLLDHGSDPDHRSKSGQTALGLALEQEYLDVAYMLSERSSESTRRLVVDATATLHEKFQRLVRSINR